MEAAGFREPVNAGFVTGGWFSTLGVRPVLGCGFLPEEAEPGRDGVTILAEAYWRRRFAGRPDVVGTTIAIDGQPVTVVGVLLLNVMRFSADVLLPFVPARYPQARDHRDLDVFARLRPGVTLDAARADLDAIARRLAIDHPANAGRSFAVVLLDKTYASLQPRAGMGLVLMLGAVAHVLLIACVNRVLGQVMGEATRLTAVGLVAGWGVAQILARALSAMLFGVGASDALTYSAVALLLAAVAMASSYLPARRAATIDPAIALRES